MPTKRTPHDVLNDAKDLVVDRGVVYNRDGSGIEDNFTKASYLAQIRLDRAFHPYEIAIILACVKNARACATPDHYDSHVDAINYEAFATLFANDYAINRSHYVEAHEQGYASTAILADAVPEDPIRPAATQVPPVT